MSEHVTILSWNNCPGEILWQIFKKLDDSSLLICLQVSVQWKAEAYYVLTKQGGGLEKTVKNAIEDVGYLFKNKSHVNLRDSFLNSLLWYNVSNATIKYIGSGGKKVKYMSTYKDCLIIVDNYGVSYYDMENNNFRNRLTLNCLTFDENDNLMVTTTYHATETIRLSVFGKRKNRIISFKGAPYYITSAVVFRIVEDSCYVVNNKGYILCIKMDKSRTHVIGSRIGRFHGCVNVIISMYVVSDHIAYIMLRTGVILRYIKMSPHPSHTCTRLRVFSPYRANLYKKTPIGMMFQLGTIMEVGPHNKFIVQYNEKTKFLRILCPRLVYACHHGNVLLIGYSDGKISIFIKRKLEKGNLAPERTINVYDFYHGPVQSKYRHIRQIKVYESFGSHVLCIITDSVVVQLLVQNLELINSDAQTENTNELCLSIFHLLNIEL